MRFHQPLGLTNLIEGKHGCRFRLVNTFFDATHYLLQRNFRYWELCRCGMAIESRSVLLPTRSSTTSTFFAPGRRLESPGPSSSTLCAKAKKLLKTGLIPRGRDHIQPCAGGNIRGCLPEGRSRATKKEGLPLFNLQIAIVRQSFDCKVLAELSVHEIGPFLAAPANCDTIRSGRRGRRAAHPRARQDRLDRLRRDSTGRPDSGHAPDLSRSGVQCDPSTRCRTEVRRSLIVLEPCRSLGWGRKAPLRCSQPLRARHRMLTNGRLQGGSPRRP
jgi:hypothetical protein